MGINFDYRALKGIYPISTDKAQLAQLLEEAKKARRILRVVSQQNAFWSSSTVKSHASVTSPCWLSSEKSYTVAMHSGSKKGRSAEVDDSYLAMAYHWKQAGFLGKSMQYYEHLGAFSAMQGSDKEAPRVISCRD